MTSRTESQGKQPVCDGCPCVRLTVRLNEADYDEVAASAQERGGSVNSVFRGLAANLARFKLVKSGDVLVFEDRDA